MEILIRNEREEDTRAVEEVTREAFWNLYVPGCSEHYIAHALRRHVDFIPELDFVAVVNGRVVGNIMYTRARLANDAGENLAIASFGPLCVHPEFQRLGIGSGLIRHSLPAAQGWDSGSSPSMAIRTTTASMASGMARTWASATATGIIPTGCWPWNWRRACWRDGTGGCRSARPMNVARARWRHSTAGSHPKRRGTSSARKSSPSRCAPS